METKRLHLSKSGALDIELVPSDVLERFDALALEALAECRKTIMMAMRFLNAALWHLPSERAALPHPLATNGRVLRYDPERVVERYRESDSELVRDCLHAILHCVFHHPFEKRYDEHDTWSLACDISVELCALDLCGERFASKLDAERMEAARMLAAHARNSTAPALYQVLRHGGPGEALYLDNGFTRADLDRFESLFKRDAHELWASYPRRNDDLPGSESNTQAIPDLQGTASGDASSATPEQAAGAGMSGVDGTRGDAQPHRPHDEAADTPENDREEPLDARDATVQDGLDDPALDELEHDFDEVRDALDAALAPDESTHDAPEPTGAEPDEDDAALERAAQEWRHISKRVEAEMRAQQHSIIGDGTLLQNLVVANKKPARYDEFLRRFATLAEDMRISDDEFDYIFYTYGLDHYGNIPLVEPLEYQESRRVREFVIALDTSGSCSGELIRTFVERTYSILRQRTSFGDSINVHLVQCDNRVRTATKVTSLRQLEAYADSFWVSGGGGTDFKPVFEYVDSLVETGEFTDLRGLIYFTDGYGAFPTKAPAYDTAFVFVNTESTNTRVPGWAMKVVMTEDEVMRS